MNISGSELIIIILVALIVFGPKELPKIGRNIGDAVQQFRKASRELAEEMDIEKKNKG